DDGFGGARLLLAHQVAYLAEHAGGQLGGQRGLAGGSLADRVDHVFGGAVLHEVAGGARPDGVDEHLPVGVHGEDHHLGPRELVAHAAGGGHAVEHGHGDVHEHDVGTELLGQPDGLLAVGGLADDVEAVLLHGA